jgi:hypothetical protein
MPNTVSVEQAAGDALVAWIASQLTDVDVNDEWPDPNVPPAASGEITVLRAGACDETLVVPPQVLKTVPDAPPAVTSNFYYRTHACEQPMQLDVWATSKPRRDDIINRLGTAMTAGKALTLSPAYFAAEGISTNQDPVVQSIVLQLASPWDHLVAAYQFEAPETDDTGDEVSRAEFRATYRGTAFFDRTVIRKLARLVQVAMTVSPTQSGASPAPHTTTLTVTKDGSGNPVSVITHT